MKYYAVISTKLGYLFEEIYIFLSQGFGCTDFMADKSYINHLRNL